MAAFGVNNEDVDSLFDKLRLEIMDGYHREGGVIILRDCPEELATSNIEVDWASAALRYPDWIKVDRYGVLIILNRFILAQLIFENKVLFSNWSGSHETGFFRRGVPTFTGPAPKEVVPDTIYGKIFSWDLSLEQIRIMSYSCNDNQSFLVEFTPYDQLMTAKRVLESCLEAKPGKLSILKVEVGKLY